MDSGANCDDESYGIMTRPLIIICFSADRTPISFSSKNGSQHLILNYACR